jgi:hypothetical protein
MLELAGKLATHLRATAICASHVAQGVAADEDLHALFERALWFECGTRCTALDGDASAVNLELPEGLRGEVELVTDVADRASARLSDDAWDDALRLLVARAGVLYLAGGAADALGLLQEQATAVLRRLLRKALTVMAHNRCKTVLLAHVLTDVARREHMHLLGTGRLGDVLALAWTRGQVLEPPERADDQGEPVDWPAAAARELALTRSKLEEWDRELEEARQAEPDAASDAANPRKRPRVDSPSTAPAAADASEDGGGDGDGESDGDSVHKHAKDLALVREVSRSCAPCVPFDLFCERVVKLTVSKYKTDATWEALALHALYALVEDELLELLYEARRFSLALCGGNERQDLIVSEQGLELAIARAQESRRSRN